MLLPYDSLHFLFFNNHVTSWGVVEKIVPGDGADVGTAATNWAVFGCIVVEHQNWSQTCSQSHSLRILTPYPVFPFPARSWQLDAGSKCFQNRYKQQGANSKLRRFKECLRIYRCFLAAFNMATTAQLFEVGLFLLKMARKLSRSALQQKTVHSL